MKNALAKQPVLYREALALLGLLLCVGLLSCAMPPLRGPSPEPSGLGRGLHAYQAPPNPAAGDPVVGTFKEPTGVLSLRQALAAALINNPELATFSWEVRAREAQALQAGLLPNPELSIEVENFAGSGERQGVDSTETTIWLGQLIELAGKRAKRHRVALLDRRLAAWDYEIRRLDVLAEVAKAFVDVLAVQERAALTEELVTVAERALRAVTAQVRAGAVSPAEQTRARVALAAGQVERDRTGRELIAARKRLAATWGSTAPTFTEVQGSLETVTPPPSASTLDQLIANNPDIARWVSEFEQRRAAVALEDARRIPNVTIGGGIRRFNDTDDTAAVLALNVPLPLMNRNQGRALEARYRLAKAHEERRAAEVRVRTALATTYENLAAAFDEVTALRNEVLPQAQVAFETTEDGYRKGLFRYLDVLDAQRTLFQLRGQYLQALATYHRDVADMERLSGEPLNTRGDEEKRETLR